jgi:hypothetical protein
MKKLFTITITGYLIFRIITSCSTQELYRDGGKINPRLCARNIDKAENIPYQIDTFFLDLLPPSLGVQFYKDGLVFLSLSKEEGKMLAKHLSFGNIQAYFAELNDTALGQHQNFSPFGSFPFPCEAITFSSDFKTMYLTKESDIDGKEKIYQAYDKGQQDWVIDPEPLDFCSSGYSYSHPTLSVDGNIMIFASDNPQSEGGMDLFITLNEKGKWSVPKNMGISINTGGNELFPFLDDKNNLYFSSDSLYGFGGYDIFVCPRNEKSWGLPINMTNHINSNCDEIGFTMNRQRGNEAFFTSRKKMRNADMQLFKLSLNDKHSITTDPEGLSMPFRKLIQVP